MNRNTILTIAVVVVLALGAWYYISTMPQTPASTSTTATTTGQTSGQGTTAGGTSGGTTLGALVAQGGNYTCTVETITSGQQSTGTVYGAGGKTRLDFTVAQNGTTVNTHIIRSGGYSYTWVDGQTTGFKTAITASTVTTPGQGGYINVDDKTNVSSTCRPWSPVATMFVTPKGITFVAR